MLLVGHIKFNFHRHIVKLYHPQEQVFTKFTLLWTKIFPHRIRTEENCATLLRYFVFKIFCLTTIGSKNTFNILFRIYFQV